jgi:hypothetical protein
VHGLFFLGKNKKQGDGGKKERRALLVKLPFNILCSVQKFGV